MEVFEDYFDPAENEGHYCFTRERDGQTVGYVYFALEEMTDQAWILWWIAVDPSEHGRGIGRELLLFAEEQARSRGGRVMFIETSSLPSYENTNRFYAKNGYEQEAVLRDFYRDGDDKIIYRKRLAT